MTVDLFIPCLVDQFYPQTGINMVKVLKAAGVQVQYNPVQTCCGQAPYLNGYWEEAKITGEKFIGAFNDENYVVGPSASCVAFVRNHYDKLFYNSGLHLEYKKLKKRIFELSDFLVSILGVVDFNAVLEEKAVLHSECSGSNRYGLSDHPLKLMKNVEGLQLLDISAGERSCGFQGLGPRQLDNIAERLLKVYCQKVMDVGASTIIVIDPSCMLNFNTYIQKQKLPLKVMHIADVLSSGN